MFTWICPKCGGEVPPAYDDCPRCAPKVTQPAPAVAATPAAATEPLKAEVAPEPARPTLPLAVPPLPAQRRGIPSSLVAALAFAGIAALLAVLYLFVLPERQEASAETEKTAVEAPGPGSQAASTHPFAKHLEVTGIRLSGGSGGKMKIQFLVVNHSAAELPEMKMDITLSSAGRDYFQFPAKVPSLGPYEVKELSTAATTDLKSYELPDWQMFRPQFRITE